MCPRERACAQSTPWVTPTSALLRPARPHRPASSYSTFCCFGHFALHLHSSPDRLRFSSSKLANTHHQLVTVHSHLEEVSPGQPMALALSVPYSGKNPAWLGSMEAMTGRCPGHSKLVAGKTFQFLFHCKKKHHYRTSAGPQEPGNTPSIWALRSTVMF